MEKLATRRRRQILECCMETQKACFEFAQSERDNFGKSKRTRQVERLHAQLLS